MSKIGLPRVPNPPTEQPKADEGKLSEGTGGGGSAAQAGGVQSSQVKRVLSAGDVERLASQAGFVRTGGKKKGRGLDVGDSSDGPIPLPEDDLDPDLVAELSAESLGQAEGQLLHHGALLARSRSKQSAGDLMGLWQAVIEGDAHGDGDAEAKEARAAWLKALPPEPPPDAEALLAVAKSMQAHFGVDVSHSPAGPQMMAASLLVAGQSEHVRLAEQQGDGPRPLDGQKLMGGASRVIDEGRQAADDARSRADNIQRNLALHRTFVPKR